MKVLIDNWNPDDPYDEPDAWERKGLITFKNNGGDEIYEVTQINNNPYLIIIL